MSDTASEEFAAAHAAWHREVEAARTAPYGPLSPIALHWLTAEPQAFAEVPGRWSADAAGEVTAVLDEADGVTRSDGSPVVAAGSGPGAAVRFGPLTGLQSLTLQWGERRIELAARSGGVILRPRDPASPDRAEYGGTSVFPPNERWVVIGRFVPTPQAEVEVGSAAGADKTNVFDSSGSVEFELDGQRLSLVLFGSREHDDLRAVFADASGADLTFPSIRFVDAEQLDDRTVRIDFNRTTNPPCAYSMSATCPFPPPGNRLPVRIEAGELRPGLDAPAG